MTPVDKQLAVCNHEFLQSGLQTARATGLLLLQAQPVKQLATNCSIRQSCFHSQRPPKLQLLEYCARIATYAGCSSICFPVALQYIQRAAKRWSCCAPSAYNSHRLLLTAVLVASKLMDDRHRNNAHYAKVGGVLLTQLNEMEVTLLRALDFRLAPCWDTLLQHTHLLQSLWGEALACHARASTAQPHSPAMPSAQATQEQSSATGRTVWRCSSGREQCSSSEQSSHVSLQIPPATRLADVRRTCRLFAGQHGTEQETQQKCGCADMNEQSCARHTAGTTGKGSAGVELQDQSHNSSSDLHCSLRQPQDAAVVTDVIAAHNGGLAPQHAQQLTGQQTCALSDGCSAVSNTVSSTCHVRDAAACVCAANLAHQPSHVQHGAGMHHPRCPGAAALPMVQSPSYCIQGNATSYPASHRRYGDEDATANCMAEAPEAATAVPSHCHSLLSCPTHCSSSAVSGTNPHAVLVTMREHALLAAGLCVAISAVPTSPVITPARTCCEV